MHVGELPEAAFELDLDESNELTFRVQVESTANLGQRNRQTRVQFVLESDECSYAFPGLPGSGRDLVDFKVPPMRGKLKEGTYRSRIEVLVENKLFQPISFGVALTSSRNVVAEIVTRPKPKGIEQTPQQIKATLSEVTRPPTEKFEEERKVVVERARTNERRAKRIVEAPSKVVRVGLTLREKYNRDRF